MNPPAAIYNAMGRERKPFTYTPGGLDLSEIKSERMARRLMRNAMSPGVQESTSPVAQSPTGPPPAFPQAAHYNNLPVQVFPAFQLPANPKVLLRTRSTPQQPRESSLDRSSPQYTYVSPPTGMDLAKDTFLTSLPPVPRRSSAELSPLATAKLGFGYPPQVSSPPVLQSAQQVSPHVPPRLDNTWSNGIKDIESATPSIILEPCLRMPSEILQSNTEDKKVKSKKKTPSKDDEVEVEATIKITKPKKTISTSVEIERKILPDGTVEETKTTTTNTIINGKIEDSKVQKETRILSPEEAKAVVEEESEEEEVEEEEEQVTEESSKKPAIVQNGLSKESEVSVKTETKKTVVTTETKEESRTETKPESRKTISTTETKVETKTEANPESKKTISSSEIKVETKTKESSEEIKQQAVREATPSEEEFEEEEESEEEEVAIPEKLNPVEKKEPIKKEIEESEEEEIEEDEEEEEVVEVIEEKTKSEQNNDIRRSPEGENEPVSEEEEEEIEEQVEVDVKENKVNSEPAIQSPTEKTEQIIEESKVAREEPEVKTIQEPEPKQYTENEKTSPSENVHVKTETSETKTETIKSADVPEVHTTTKKESTEITSSVSDNSYGRPVSTQTELHRVENIVTVNKTVKSLDNSYEQLTQHGLPTVRTYFAPPTREKLSTSPQPAKPYTPTFTPERKPERRHSLLLDRLSTERQVAPPESYQNTYNYQSNQNYETVSNQWNQEPQSEVVNVSNVKPSSISNSQWYQAPQQQPNLIYNNVQPTTPNTQQQQQPSYTENLPYESPRPANNYQAPETQSYTPKPSSWGSSNLNNLDRLPSINTQSNQYSFMSNKKTTESYSQQSTGTNQFSAGYVPPPWESEKSVIYQESTPQFYQAPATAPVTNTNLPPAWQPSQQPNYTKTNPVSYQPPAPNASFVKQGTPTPKQIPGRKTYYSEYERRYISVPESTFIPAETKVQPQWDASPQYYYDNPEPAEEIEQPWRKELREFTEKTTKIEETTSVQPPWQQESNYPKAPSTPYTPQATWSQTLRPRSFKEKSFDAETLQYQNTQEWPKSNTLNRRPVSAFVKTRLNSPGFERTRGVSVDRYNASSYQPPAPYTPSANNNYSLPWETQEQPQIFSPTPQQCSDARSQTASGPQTQQHYHNPQVPAYHVRAPTEPREYHYQPRWSGQGRERPVQSRSFKYLQMLTGTEDGVEQPEPFVAQQPQHSAPKPRRV